MSDDLPPLNALRAFEAAGRHLSIKKAARELSVTPAAVSHQVKALEDHLDTRLFRRVGNTLALTDAGRTLLPGLRAGFEAFGEAVEALRGHGTRGAIVLSVAPVFAAQWLIPRLGRFHRLHPEIDVRISANLELADFERDGVDAAIRVGRGRYPGLVADRLFGEQLVPVCSPRLLEGETALRTPEDLRHHVLLHFDWPGTEEVLPGWGAWLEAVGTEGIDASAGPRFAQADHAMQAAAEGLGVALGWRRLAQDDLATGRLAIPFDVALPADVAFHLVYPETARSRPKLVAFRDWLLGEASEAPAQA